MFEFDTKRAPKTTHSHADDFPKPTNFSQSPFDCAGNMTGSPLYHGIIKRREARDFAVKLLEDVSLSSEQLQRFTHKFSGGQRQCICIARALSLSPKLLDCDESVSELDVSIQAQILNFF